MATYNKQPIYAGETASSLKKSQTCLINAAAKLEEAISLITENLHGSEFDMACTYIGKIISLMQDEVDDTSSVLDKLTIAINDYNDSIYDEEGNKVYITKVDYHSSKKINYTGYTSTAKKTVAEEVSNIKSIDDTSYQPSKTTNTTSTSSNQNNTGTVVTTYSTNRNNTTTTSSSTKTTSSNKKGTTVTHYTTKDEATTSTKTGHVTDYKDYIVAENAVSLSSYVSFLRNNGICQDTKDEYSGKCLGFAYTQAYGYYIGDTSIKPDDGKNYKYASKFQSVYGTKDEILTEIYNEISAGRPVVLQVNGNKAGTSRHFVTVVGFKNTVKDAASLKEEDLLIIDSWDAKLETMDGKGSGTRFMTQGTETGNGNYPYRILKFK